MDPTQLAPKTALGDPDFNPTPETAADPAICPKCQTPLIDPQGLGWCRKCGFCKSLEDDKARVPLETKKPKSQQPTTLGLVEFCQYSSKLPAWAWVLLGGAATVVAINVPLTLMLPPASLARAMVATGEIGLGILLIVAAQIWALFLLAPHDDKLNFKDAIMPGRLWVLAVSKLPQTRGQVWLVVWGVSAILSAILVVGGLTHWMTYLPKATVPAPQKTSK